MPDRHSGHPSGGATDLMTSITHEQTAALPALAGPSERAVFVTDDDRRSRRLRKGAAAALLVSALWIVGLGIGMLGAGALPDVTLPLPGRSDAPKRPSSDSVRPTTANSPASDIGATSRAEHRRSTSTAAAERRAAATPSSKTSRPRARSRARTSRGATPPAAPPSVAPVVPAPVTATQPGRARRRLPAPPGQSQKAEVTPTTPAPRGQGSDNSTHAKDPSLDHPTAPTTPP